VNRNTLRLVLFLIVTVGGGLLIGVLNIPGPWYAALAKPSFNPPNWVFGPAWTVLYIVIAIAGWRVTRNGWNDRMAVVWIAQLVLNFLWSPTFFSLHAIRAALIIIALMLVCILAFIGVGLRRDRLAALLFVPYAAWITFALTLNSAILQLNGPGG
jgi:tryptophan-rich sensory protein